MFLLGLLASSLVERRAEARIVQIAKGKIKKLESRNPLWGEVYPSEYQSWERTAEDNFESEFNGNTQKAV